jgi:hypothetical protein
MRLVYPRTVYTDLNGLICKATTYVSFSPEFAA